MYGEPNVRPIQKAQVRPTEKAQSHEKVSSQSILKKKVDFRRDTVPSVIGFSDSASDSDS